MSDEPVDPAGLLPPDAMCRKPTVDRTTETVADPDVPPEEPNGCEPNVTKGRPPRPDTLTEASTAEGQERGWRTQQILSLRKAGWSFDQIAKKLGLSVKTVRNLSDRVMRKFIRDQQEMVGEILMLEVARLDQMWSRLHELVIETPDGEDPEATLYERVKVMEQMIKIQERRAKLLGLDAPEKKQVMAAKVSLDRMSLPEVREEMRKLGLQAPVPLLEHQDDLGELPGEECLPHYGTRPPEPTGE